MTTMVNNMHEGAASDAEALPHYRRVRDEIRALVEKLPQVPR